MSQELAQREEAMITEQAAHLLKDYGDEDVFEIAAMSGVATADDLWLEAAMALTSATDPDAYGEPPHGASDSERMSFAIKVGRAMNGAADAIDALLAVSRDGDLQARADREIDKAQGMAATRPDEDFDAIVAAAIETHGAEAAGTPDPDTLSGTEVARMPENAGPDPLAAHHALQSLTPDVMRDTGKDTEEAALAAEIAWARMGAASHLFGCLAAAAEADPELRADLAKGARAVREADAAPEARL